MKQAKRYGPPSVRVSWATSILSAPPEKFGSMMQRLAMRALHRRDPRNSLHIPAQCDLCLPATKYFTPGQRTSEKPQVAAAIKPAPVSEPAAKPVAPTAAPLRISSPATHRPLAALASLLHSPVQSERQPQLSKEKGA